MLIEGLPNVRESIAACNPAGEGTRIDDEHFERVAIYPAIVANQIDGIGVGRLLLVSLRGK